MKGAREGVPGEPWDKEGPVPDLHVPLHYLMGMMGVLIGKGHLGCLYSPGGTRRGGMGIADLT